MRTLIVGAGAVGGYFGARLLAAGRDVTFLVRPRTAQLLASNGLRLISPDRGDVHIANPPTVQADTLLEPYDLILLSMKAYDLADAMESIAPAVGSATAILPLLNGMAHMDALDRRFGAERVLGGTSFISSVREADGTIRHLNDRDELLFGERFANTSPRVEAIADVLMNANFHAQPRPAILQDMWQKWVFLATLAGMTCTMRASIGEIVAAGAASLTTKLFDECVLIAAAEGFPPREAYRERQQGILTADGSTMTASMLRDLEAGAAIEAEHVVGDLLDHGRRHQLDTPMLELVYAHLRCYELRRGRTASEA